MNVKKIHMQIDQVTCQFRLTHTYSEHHESQIMDTMHTISEKNGKHKQGISLGLNECFLVMLNLAVHQHSSVSILFYWSVELVLQEVF